MTTTKQIDLSPLMCELGSFKNNIGNFSIIPYGDCFLCSFRQFGYWISNEGQYLTSKEMRLEHPDEHLFCILDKDFNFVKSLPIIKNEYYKPTEFANERTYLEDGRFVVWGDELYFGSSTFYQHNNHYEKMGWELQKIDVSDAGVSATHIYNTSEAGLMGRHKNFMAIPDRPFQFVIGTSSKGVQVLDVEHSTIIEALEYDGKDLYRGNTPLVRTDDGYITITHKVSEPDIENQVKTYYNHFVEYDTNLNVRRISSPFKLTNSPIEFVTTMLVDGDGLWIGVTEMDETPMLVRLDMSTMREFL